MALSDAVIITGLGFVMNYFVLYRNNKFLGSVAFLILSSIMLTYSTDTLVAGTSMVMIAISIISVIYTLLPNPHSGKKRR